MNNKKFGHYYCFSCAKQWYLTNNKKCLLCQNFIDIEKITFINGTNVTDNY
jgi:hypothetical protein